MGDAPYLLTPGPLTTNPEVRDAMRRDWGSRDLDFIALTKRVRTRLCDIAHASESHVCVLLQGSGTFAVEAMLGTLVPKDGKLLVLINGAYGKRIADIARRAGRTVEILEDEETRTPSPEDLRRRLTDDPAITHVAAVHCETTSGILNPIEAIAAVVAGCGRSLLIDAMSAFGALPIDARTTVFDGLAASANKCLEGVPGVGVVLCRTEALAAAVGNAHSVSLDLHAQWRGFEANGQWRFTPPTHVLAALNRALDLLDAEGGPQARQARYHANCRALVDGMRALGFETMLPDSVQAPIIVTFKVPDHPGFEVGRFHDRMHEKGFVLYPGKLTQVETFRIGCIGHVDPAVLAAAVAAAGEVLSEMGVRLTPEGA